MATLLGIGAVASIATGAYIHSRKAKVINEIKSIPVVDSEFLEKKSTNTVIMKYPSGIETPAFNLSKQTTFTYLQPTLLSAYDWMDGKHKVMLVDSPVTENVFEFMGRFVDANDYFSLPLQPSNSVTYSKSTFDSELTTYVSGSDLANRYKNVRPRFASSINPSTLYKLTLFNGNKNDPLYYLGNKSGDKFVFRNFSRDLNSLVANEIHNQTNDHDLGLALSFTSAAAFGLFSLLLKAS